MPLVTLVDRIRIGDAPSDIAVDETGVYLAGETRGTAAASGIVEGIDVWIKKYSNKGKLLWEATVDSGDNDYSAGLSVDPVTGSVYLLGTTNGQLGSEPNPLGSDPFLIKYNPSGIREWSRVLVSSPGSISNSYRGAQSVFAGQGDSIFLAGHNYLARYDSSGELKWSQLVEGLTGDLDQGFLTVVVDQQGLIWAGGAMRDGSGDLRPFVACFDSEGNRVNLNFDISTLFSSSSFVVSMGVDSGGLIQLLVADVFYPKRSSLLEIDPLAHTIRFKNQMDSDAGFNIEDILEVLPSGGILIVSNEDFNQPLLKSFDANGDLLWQQRLSVDNPRSGVGLVDAIDDRSFVVSTHEGQADSAASYLSLYALDGTFDDPDIERHRPQIIPSNASFDPDRSSLVASLTTVEAGESGSGVYELVGGLGDQDNHLFLLSGSQLYFTSEADQLDGKTLQIRVQVEAPSGLLHQQVLQFQIEQSTALDSGLAASSRSVLVHQAGLGGLLVGRDGVKDVFMLPSPSSTTMPDLIVGFNSAEDRLQIKKSAFSGLKRGIKIHTVASKKQLKLFKRGLNKSQFVLNQRSGELVYDQNRKKPGLGAAGGVFAVFDTDTLPVLGPSNFELS